MGSLRINPSIPVGGAASEIREVQYQISTSASIGILGLIGVDALIEEILVRGAARPTASSNIRLFRHRANSTAVDNGTPVAGSVVAAQWITEPFTTGAGTTQALGNGPTGGTGTPATKATMRMTLQTAQTGNNSGVAPLNNVLYASDLIGYQTAVAADTGMTGGAALTGAVGVIVTIRYREIDISRITGVSNANYVDG